MEEDRHNLPEEFGAETPDSGAPELAGIVASPESVVTEPAAEDDVEDEARRARMMGGIALSCLAVAGVLLFLFTTLSGGSASASGTAARDIPKDRCPGIAPSALVLSRMKLRDTVYTTDNAYLEINLSKQTVTVHHRDGHSNTFLISSGNKSLKEGISTPTGFFTVQNKTPLAISKQFHDAKLFNWIGVQGGVGFHALTGSGYYWSLGKHPSSHGCIRMSHEEVKQMYDMVEPGMPIISHYGNPARVVAFCNAEDTLGAALIDSASVYNRHLGKPRLQSLFEGNYWIAPQPRLVHLRGQRLRWGMECGDAGGIPTQRIPKGPSIQNFLSKMSPVAHPDRASVAMQYASIFESARRFDSVHRRERADADKEMNKPQDIRE